METEKAIWNFLRKRQRNNISWFSDIKTIKIDISVTLKACLRDVYHFKNGVHALKGIFFVQHLFRKIQKLNDAKSLIINGETEKVHGV